jgi:hypothetical protein
MSILSDVKLDMGISPDDTDFDDTIIRYINTTFSILYQLGVGPKKGYRIYDDGDDWDDFLLDSTEELEMVKTYVCTKVAYMFDHPSNSSYANALKSINDELEWRLNVAVDPEEEL